MKQEGVRWVLLIRQEYRKDCYDISVLRRDLEAASQVNGGASHVHGEVDPGHRLRILPAANGPPTCPCTHTRLGRTGPDTTLLCEEDKRHDSAIKRHAAIQTTYSTRR